MDVGQPKVFIEEFSMKDYDEVYSLWKEVFPANTDVSYSRERVEFFLCRNPGTSFIARIGGRIVGAVLAGNDGRRGYIHHLGLSEDCRGRGIGRMLLQRAEEALAALGIDKVNLLVFTDNESAKVFYEKVGYSKRDDIDFFSKWIKE